MFIKAPLAWLCRIDKTRCSYSDTHHDAARRRKKMTENMVKAM